MFSNLIQILVALSIVIPRRFVKFDFTLKSILTDLYLKIQKYILQQKNFFFLVITVQSFLLTNARIVDYPIVYCNEGFAKMTGHSRMDMMQKSGNCSYLYGDQTTQEMKDRLVQALDNQTKEQLEILLYKKNRRLFVFFNLFKLISPPHFRNAPLANGLHSPGGERASRDCPYAPHFP